MIHIPLHLVAALDYPSAPVMILSTLAISAFIFVGGWLFRRAAVKELNERRAYQRKGPARGSKGDKSDLKL